METNEVNDDEFDADEPDELDAEPDDYEPGFEELRDAEIAYLGFRADMIEAGYGDPEDWDHAAIQEARDFDDLLGK